ncbi:MAG: cation-translocating P-type ATPase [Chlorobi bacterium]|nr:cation-translocating P-type ATPase [Chlorobiota bacterium]
MGNTNYTFSIDGMTCSSCVVRVENAIRSINGVIDVSVNLANHSANVITSNDTIYDSINDKIKKIGYNSILIEDDYKLESAANNHLVIAEKRFYLSLIPATLVFFSAMLPMIIPSFMDFFMYYQKEIIISQAVLTLFIIIFPGRIFFTTSIKGLLHLSVDMNTLVAIGTGAAFVFSTFTLLIKGGYLITSLDISSLTLHDIYYESSSVVICLVLLGRWLEARATHSSADAIKDLIKLKPKIAHKKIGENEFSDVPMEFVLPDDILFVKPGEVVPTDGIIVSGFSSIDESMINGEPLPKDKVVNDKVIGGSINSTGSFLFRATAEINKTLLAGIIKTVKQAQSSKPPVQRIADKIASVFVPIVLLIALGTFFYWYYFTSVNLAYSLLNAISVLVIACPCAMGLAVPTAVITSSGNAAKNGILIKDAVALEKIGKVNLFVFDKTGTLTIGKPQVIDAQSFGNLTFDETMSYAASAE